MAWWRRRRRPSVIRIIIRTTRRRVIAWGSTTTVGIPIIVIPPGQRGAFAVMATGAEPTRRRASAVIVVKRRRRIPSWRRTGAVGISVWGAIIVSLDLGTGERSNTFRNIGFIFFPVLSYVRGACHAGAFQLEAIKFLDGSFEIGGSFKFDKSGELQSAVNRSNGNASLSCSTHPLPSRSRLVSE